MVFWDEHKKIINLCHLLQPAPPAPLQEVSLTQDPLGVTQTLDPSLLSAGDPPTPREESTELPLLEHLRWVCTGRPRVTFSAVKAHLTAVDSGAGPARPDQTHSSLRDSFHQPSFNKLSGTTTSSYGPLQYWMDLVIYTHQPLSFSAKGVPHLIACGANARQIMKISANLFIPKSAFMKAWWTHS